MDKCKYIKIFDLKWENSLKYRSIPYWWKYEGELFEMVQSCLDESDEYIDEKKWVDSHWEKKKMYRKIKIKNKKNYIFSRVIKKDLQIDEVIESMISDKLK